MHTCTRYHKKYTVTVFCKLEYNSQPPPIAKKKMLDVKILKNHYSWVHWVPKNTQKWKEKMDTISKSWQCVCIDDISQAINISNNISKISFKKVPKLMPWLSQNFSITVINK